MAASHTTVETPEVDRAFATAKCIYFSDVHVWPLRMTLDPEGWLTNFKTDDAKFATQLLNGFTYFSEDMIDAVFYSAFQTLSRDLTPRNQPYSVCQTTWQSFVDRAIVTYVTDEEPNPSDSGLAFARKARQRLGLREPQIMTQAAALFEIVTNGARPTVFVDDFVGTGNQFLETWRRPTLLSNSLTTSFLQVAAQVRGSNFFYCPAFVTEVGLQRLKSEAPAVRINAGHVISSRYSAFADSSFLWPPDLRASGVEFLRRVSRDAGIPDTGGASPGDWQGFGKLGLAFAFHNSVPDATLPLFYWDQNGWKPLIRRV